MAARTEGNVKLQFKDFDVIKFAHSAAVVAGEVIVLDSTSGLVGIASKVGSANEEIPYWIKGTFNLPIASGVTVSQFDICYWDVSENEIITSGAASGDPVVGYAVEAGSAAGGYVDIALNETASENVVVKSDLASGIKAEYMIIGYGTVASDAGTGGTIAVAGALTTDHVQATAIDGWTDNATGGPALSAWVSGAGTVTYVVNGTTTAGTAGGLVVDVIRATS
jgi:predicted RecA/RadA family phage recombinase